MFFLPSQAFGSTTLPDRIHVEKGSLDFLMNTSESITNDDYFPFIQAMQSLIPTLDINDLTLPDFYTLVVYARLQMFPNSPINYNYQCRQTVFNTPIGTLSAKEVKQAISGGTVDPEEKLNPKRCNTSNKVSISSIKDFEILNFEPEGFDTDRFDIPRVHLLAEWKRLIKEPRYRYIVPIVSWLKEGDTIQEKMRILNDDLELFDELSKLNVNHSFGLRSRVTHECSCCAHTSELPFHIDNQSFIRM